MPAVSISLPFPRIPARRFIPRPRHIALVCSLLVTATLVACAGTEPYRAPLPDVVRSAPFDAARSMPQVLSSAPPDHWWQLYDDPALNALVHEALAQNRDLAVAAARVERARAMLGQPLTSK
jgi:outer membrane protein TolC